jgi:hypothetical protein
MAVHRGVVRAFYRITEWRGPTSSESAEEPASIPRWAFMGARDQLMETLYRFEDVSALLPQAAQKPITYVNCGRASPSRRRATCRSSRCGRHTWTRGLEVAASHLPTPTPGG